MLLLIQHDSCKSAIKSFLPVVSRCYMMGEPVVYIKAESRPPGVPNPIQKRNTRLLPSLDWRCIHAIRSLTLLITPLAPLGCVCTQQLTAWSLAAIFGGLCQTMVTAEMICDLLTIVRTDVNLFDVTTPSEIRFLVGADLTQQGDTMFPHKTSASSCYCKAH